MAHQQFTENIQSDNLESIFQDNNSSKSDKFLAFFDKILLFFVHI
jgi:hypothetical protein